MTARRLHNSLSALHHIPLHSQWLLGAGRATDHGTDCAHLA